MKRFRVASDEDLDWLFEQANEPEKMERLGRGELSFDEFKAQFEKERGRLFIWEDTSVAHDGRIGCILLQDRGRGYLGIPWSVHPKLRGQGRGSEMARAAVRAFPGNKRAIIKTDNIPSLKTALSVGYKISGIKDGHYDLLWDDVV